MYATSDGLDTWFIPGFGTTGSRQYYESTMVWHNVLCNICTSFKKRVRKSILTFRTENLVDFFFEGFSPPLMSWYQDFLLKTAQEALAIWCAKLSARDVTAKVIFERLYLPPGVLWFLSFFLSGVSKTQPNHWTKRMANTRLTTYTQEPVPDLIFFNHMPYKPTPP